jgi:Bacterial SH3 domain
VEFEEIVMKNSLLLATLFLSPILSPVLSVPAVLAQKPDPTVAPSTTPSTAPGTVTLPEAVVCTNGSPLNLREAPDGRVLTTIAIGTRVQLIAPPAGDWQPIAYGNFRGYVWKAYLADSCSGGTPAPLPTPVPTPIGSVTPARCGANDPLLRNVSYTGGLPVFDRPSSQGTRLALVNNGGVIRLDGPSTVDAQGSIWQPINHPTKGFILSGSNGIVTNIVYCTRFYSPPVATPAPNPAVPPAKP